MLLRFPGLLLLSISAGAAVTPLPSLPVAFEDRGASFVAPGFEHSLVLTPAAAILKGRNFELKLRLRGANQSAPMSGIDRQEGKAAYFRGTQTRDLYPLYSQVRMQGIYPGIDMVFRGTQQRFEYDFDIAAGRDPQRISLHFEGADRVHVDRNGDLIMKAGHEEIRQPKPLSWQTIDGRREFVNISYRLEVDGSVRFRVGRHRRDSALLIDPQVVFETPFGGNQSVGSAIALDSQGNIYAAGRTTSATFPTMNPLQSKPGNPSLSAFVTKWSPDGSRLIYSTYLGGSVFDFATNIAVDASGNAYIAGYTNSPDFPITTGAFQKTLVGRTNAFIAKLAPSGSQLIYSTFLGAGSEQTNGIAIDAGGNAVLVGLTASAGFPTTPNAFQSAPVAGCADGGLPAVGVPLTGDAFIARLAADGGSLLFSTLFGGNCGTTAQDLTLDPAGNIWIAGATASSDLPVTADALQPTFGGGLVDGFVARFTPTGALAYSSYLGGNAYDTITGIALDPAGNLYVAGVSGGLPQPASTGAYQPDHNLLCFALGIGPGLIVDNGDAFLARLTPGATSISRLTYLGGGCNYGGKVSIDAFGAPWIAGSFFGPGSPYPTVGPFDIRAGSNFVSKLSPDLTQLLFSTYFDGIGGLALDANGLAYVTGGTSNGPQNAYVAKIDPSPSAVSLDQVLTPGAQPQTLVLAPGEIVNLIGKNLGPATVTPGVVNSGFVTSSVAGVQVDIGGTPAPLLSVSATEIVCVVPFELAGQRTASIQVQYNGTLSNSVLMPVSPVAVQVLGVFNEDFTPNSTANPARAGSMIQVYVAGVGQTSPASQDGQVNQPPYNQPAIPITATYYLPPNTMQQIAPITWVGAAPGAVAGVLQVNFIAPPVTSTIELRAGGTGANPGVAVAVQRYPAAPHHGAR